MILCEVFNPPIVSLSTCYLNEIDICMYVCMCAYVYMCV